MKIKNLESITLSEITNIFNEAFADYIMKVTATEEYLQNRWEGAGVNYSLSFGAFVNDKLVGFIIHGIDQWNGLKTAFNIGTGVIPEQRGKKITKKLYNHAIPVLKRHGIKQCLLEVIQENYKAIKAYKSVGFEKERELISYTYKNGQNHDKIKSNLHLTIKTETGLQNADWETIKIFWEFQPSWEHSISSLMRKSEVYDFVRLFKEGNIVGYAVINPITGSVPQFGVAQNERGKGYAGILFRKLTLINEQLRVINVDNRSIASIRFLEKWGFQHLISQYEMKMKIL